MDERIFKFKPGRPIPAWDLQHRLYPDAPVGPECKDTATVFRINSTYMEITDKPHMIRHRVAGAAIVATLGLITLLYGVLDTAAQRKHRRSER